MNKGAKIKERRKYLHLTLKEVANAVGVTEPTVQRWESGNIESIRADRLSKLSTILQLPVEEVTNWFNKEKEWDELDAQSNLEEIYPEVEIAERIQEIYGKDVLFAFSKFLELTTEEQNKVVELFSVYSKLDEIDRAEIRGEMKQMLKADKYAIEKESLNEKAI